MIHFEDYVVGVKKTVGSASVGRDEIVDYARRYDPQPFHIDEAAARESIFGGLTASSCHTFSMMSLIHSRQPEKSALVANLGADSLRFPEPVRPDDTLTLTSECVSKRVSKSRPGIGIVTTMAVLTNQAGQIVMEMRTNYMVSRRSSD